MEDKRVRLRLAYSSKLDHIREINKSFDIGRLLIAYHGKNRNGSDISKDAFERAAKTMFNCPVVCNYDPVDDTIGGHDCAVLKTEDGGLRIVNKTVPLGVVPESSEWSWETVTEEDGNTHEYFSADVLLWKRQDAYRKIKNDGICGQSMEINVLDGHQDKDRGCFVVEDFEFTAFCLLGEDVEPCFESASLELYTCDDFSGQMAEMMRDFKENFTYIHSAMAEKNIEANEQFKEGGNDLDEKIALAEEFGYSIDDLDFAVNDLTVEELREKFEAMKATAAADVEDIAENNEEQQFRLEGEARTELINALEAEKIETPYGEEPRYWFWDYDKDKMEVYGTDWLDWNIYGFSFAPNGDAFTVDFASKKRMRIALVDFDEGEQQSPFAGAFAVIKDGFDRLSDQFRAASDTLSSQRDELNELRQYKKDAEEKQAKADRDAVFAKFEDLEGIDEFAALKENCDGFDAAALEEKCYAIRGRNNMQAKFSAEPRAPKTKVVKDDYADEPYGGLFLKYGHRASK